MIDLIKKQQIILRHVNNDSNCQIAKDLGIDKNTVIKYVNEYEEILKAVIEQEPGTDPNTLIATIVEKTAYNCKNRGPKASATEAQEVICKCLAENEEKRLTGRCKQQMRKTDIHGYLVKQGFDISYSTVKRLVREMEDIHKEAYIRQEHSPVPVGHPDQKYLRNVL